MKIPGYTYITHKLIQRPWGPECRFTVAKPDGVHINEVIPIKSMDVSEAELSALIQNLCDRITAPPPVETIKVTNQDGTTTTLEITA